MSGTLLHIFTTGGAGIGAVDRTELRVVEAFLSRTLLLFILSQGLAFRASCKSCRKSQLTIVSGYSICTTLMFLISSGERRPNWISWIVFSGAVDGVKLKFDILADGLLSPRVYLCVSYACSRWLAQCKKRCALRCLPHLCINLLRPLQALAAGTIILIVLPVLIGMMDSNTVMEGGAPGRAAASTG